MKHEQYSLVESYELHGLGVLPEYRIVSTSDTQSLQSIMDRDIRFNKIIGDSGYSYTILPKGEAEALVKAKNAERERDIAIFRHEVYGEPLPQAWTG